MDVRSATTGDVDPVARCITLAFATDPVWEPALRRADGRTDHLEPYWRGFVAAAVDQGTAFMTDGGEAVAIWVPPGGDELPPAGVDALDAFLEDNLDTDAVRAMHTLYDRFEASRGPLGPHLLPEPSRDAPRPSRPRRRPGPARGQPRELGRLWRPVLSRVDEPGQRPPLRPGGLPPIGGFETVLDRAWVTAMWRDVGGASV